MARTTLPPAFFTWLVLAVSLTTLYARADTPATVRTRDQFATDSVPVADPTPPAKLGIPPASPPPEPQPPAAIGDPVATPPAPPAEAPPQGVTIRLRGRIEADAITATQDRKDKALYGDFQNAVGFRRVRLGTEGTVGEQTRWVTEIDFADGNVNLKDAFLAVNQLPILREVRVGHMAEPFSLEGFTRSVWFPLAERSPGFTLDPARNWGVAFFSYTDDKRIVFQAGAFKSGTDNTGTDVGDGNDMAYTARVTGLVLYDNSDDSLDLLHVGGAISQRYAKDDKVTYNQGPQSSLLETGDNPFTPFVPTLTIPAKQNQLFNVQAALVHNALSFQAEWIASRVDQIGGGPVFLQGAYVLASYFLTGEHRNYNREVGTFWEPHVKSPFVCMEGKGDIGRGPGAWEVTARLAYLNFDSPNLAPEANGLKVGDKLTTLTLGVNWYLNDNARIMFNYVYAMPTDPNFGSSKASTYTIRSAIFW